MVQKEGVTQEGGADAGGASKPKESNGKGWLWYVITAAVLAIAVGTAVALII